MRKKYQVPEFEVKALDGEDIVTSSVGELVSDVTKRDGAWEWNPWVKEDNVQ